MRCPGQNTQYWKPEDVFEAECPNCAYLVEFFKDEPVRRCKRCGHRLLNPKLDFGCATYCQFAEQCLGNIPSELLSQKRDLLKNQIAIEMKRYFGKDFKRIGHASRVARYAEMIAREELADIAVVLIAAYLHDIGIKEAELKYKSSAPVYQEELGPPVARKIMERVKADKRLIEEVCDIIAHHHHPGNDETKNFKVLYDADLIVNLEDKNKESALNKKELKKMIDEAFYTESGRRIAGDLFISGSGL